MSNLVSQSEFARLQGVDKSHITRLKSAGRLVIVDGKVDVEASRALIAQTAHSSYADNAKNSTQPAYESTRRDEGASIAQPPQGRTEQAAMSLQSSRAVKENYLARMAKLTFERESGKLVDADEVRLFAADLGATFRAALEILPDRISSELVPLQDVDAVRAVLVENFEQLLSDLSTKFEKGINRAN